VPVELAELAETLNEMLARLEDSFRRLKDFSSDLAHELRTPISNLMTQTQVALTQSAAADEYREVLANRTPRNTNALRA
jgi:two-component system heavy metal sensor histidine kinase CusS